MKGYSEETMSFCTSAYGLGGLFPIQSFLGLPRLKALMPSWPYCEPQRVQFDKEETAYPRDARPSMQFSLVDRILVYCFAFEPTHCGHCHAVVPDGRRREGRITPHQCPRHNKATTPRHNHIPAETWRAARMSVVRRAAAGAHTLPI